ncbi:hypothetical protein HDU98_012069, partial [Podochytrium sp. JEL0797]
IEESLTYPNSGYFGDRLKETVLTHFRYTNNVTKSSDRVWSDDTEERARAREAQGLTDALPPLRAIVLDFSAVNNVDYTGLQALLDSKDDLTRFAGRSVPFHFANVRKQQLNTLVRVPSALSGANTDATPGAPGERAEKGVVAGLLGKFKKDPETASVERENRVAALEYFHFSVSEAVDAAEKETRHVLSEEEEVQIVAGEKQ